MLKGGEIILYYCSYYCVGGNQSIMIWASLGKKEKVGGHCFAFGGGEVWLSKWIRTLEEKTRAKIV